MDQERPAHPLQQFLDENRVSYEKAASLCKKAGHDVSADYVKNIARGWNRPSFDLAEALSLHVTRGGVKVDDLMRYPYTRKPSKAA